MRTETRTRCELLCKQLKETGAMMNRKSFHIAAATMLVVAVGCGDEPPPGPPPGVDLKAGQSPAVIPAPVSPQASKSVKASDVHKVGPSTTLE
jgi:hypothetical protein